MKCINKFTVLSQNGCLQKQTLKDEPYRAARCVLEEIHLTIIIIILAILSILPN